MLEVGDKIRLKLAANSTRRARWDAKLGFQKKKGFVVGLSSLSHTGGSVACIDVIITRIYPLMYLDTLDDGTKLMRSSREEKIAKRGRERRQQAQIETTAMEVVEEQQHEKSPDTPNSRLEFQDCMSQSLSDLVDLTLICCSIDH